MHRLLHFLLIITVSCGHQHKNQLIGTWQLVKKSNDHKVIFQFDPRIHLKKYIYWFKNDSILITKDDDGGNMQVNAYLLSGDKITLFDSLHSNTFFFKTTGNKLSMKSVFSPLNLELKKLD